MAAKQQRKKRTAGRAASGEPAPSRESQRALDWLNFLIADVQTGFGPFVALYLASYN